MPKIVKLGKKPLETGAIIVLLLVAALGVAFKVDKVQALSAGCYGSPGWWKNAHNWVILNALELLKIDYGYESEPSNRVTEANILEKYLGDAVNGSYDADYGSSFHLPYYINKGEEQNFDEAVDMSEVGGFEKCAGGFSHFYDPWTHIGTGVTENPYACIALATGVGLVAGTLFSGGTLAVGAIAGLGALIYSAIAMEQVMDWTDWFGKNAGEAARIAFDRACQAWNAGYEDKAMYYLGMVLHLIGDVVAVPYHTVNWLFGQKAFSMNHEESEGWVNEELSNALGSFGDADLQSAVCAHTEYNIDRSGQSLPYSDHGIYSEDLFKYSDGVYVAGDPIGPGHIYQLPNRVERFIDFGAHESIEWFPMFAQEIGQDYFDLDDWWEIPNYIETGDLHMKSSDEAFDSRLIFHLEGVESTTADFEWAIGNDEAIDMENNFYTDLGYVEAYDDYVPSTDKRIGGPWVCDWWSGPEPSAGNTLQIRTVVDHGLEGDYWDDDCDGWQIGEIRCHGNILGPCADPLYWQLNGDGQYQRSDGTLGYLKDVVWDQPIPYQNARRIATVHLLDLASKLCAGVVKLFFEEVGLPTVYPETELLPLEWSGPSGTTYIPFYINSSTGTLYTEANQVQIYATMCRTCWDDEEGKYIPRAEPGKTVSSIWYSVDDQGLCQALAPTYPEYDIPSEYQYAINVALPDDELPHTITYWGEGCIWTVTDPPQIRQYVQEDKINIKTVVRDLSPPQLMTSIGEPRLRTPPQMGGGGEFIPGELFAVGSTPITLTATDGGGSGVSKIRYMILNLDENRYVTGFDGETVFVYKGPFNLGGRHVYSARIPGYLDMKPCVLEAVFSHGQQFPSQPPGHYRIISWCQDNIGDTMGLPVPAHYSENSLDITLVDHLDGVDVKIDPSLQIIEPQSTATYNVSVTNRYQTNKTFDLFLQGLDPSWFSFSQPSITIDPETTGNITLTVSPPDTSLILKEYPFWITAALQEPPSPQPGPPPPPWERDPLEQDTEQARIKLVVKKPLKPADTLGNVAITAPSVIPVAAGTSVQTSLTVESSDISHCSVVRLEISTHNIPLGERADSAWFSWTEQYLYMTLGKAIRPRIDIPLGIWIPPGSQVGQKFFDAVANSLVGYPRAHDEVRVCLSEDTEPPITSLNIDSPKYIDASSNTYVTSQTTLTLDATDGDQGVGIAATAYRFRNSTYDTGWIATALLAPIPLAGLDDGTYYIDYNSTDRGGNLEPTKTTTVTLDNTGPTASILTPPIGGVLTDGATFTISAIDAGSGVHSVNASVRMGNGIEAQPCGFEDLPAIYDEGTGKWTLFFNTLQLKDGYYTVVVETDDNLGNTGPPVFTPCSIRNWALSEELPSSAKNKAGRTMPIKFSLRIAAPVDPTQPFVYNEELTIIIYATTNPSNILQTSTYGDSAQDYRIDTISEKYITNFKTLLTPMQYTVSIYLDTFLIRSFTFRTELLRAHYQDTSDNSRIDP